MPGAWGQKKAPNGAAAWREQAELWRTQKDTIDDVESGFIFSLSRWLGGGDDHRVLHGTDEEQQGLLGKAQKSLSNMAERTGDAVTGSSMGAMLQVASISRERWAAFFALLATGALLMAASLWMLPLLVLAPQKFAGMFTTGSLCFLASFAALKGPATFTAHLFSGGRLFLSAGYVGSMAATLWASMWYRSTLLTMVFSVLQISQLLWFAASYIPGGSMLLGFVCDGMSVGLKRLCCASCCANKTGSTPL